MFNPVDDIPGLCYICYIPFNMFSILNLVAYLHFVISLSASSAVLFPLEKGISEAFKRGNDVLMPPLVPPMYLSSRTRGVSSIHNDGNGNVTQNEASGPGVEAAEINGALSLPLRMANETVHQDGAAIERDDGSPVHESSQRTPIIQSCPAEPHIQCPK